MNKYKFDVPLFDVEVELIEIFLEDEPKNVLEECAFFGLHEEDLTDIEEKLKRECFDGGELYRNYNEKKFLVLFYRHTTTKEQIRVYAHEKRHLEDRILEFCNIDDMETAAYLSGYLAVEFYKFYNVEY